jgi:Fe-coproporphyrin III synthase
MAYKQLLELARKSIISNIKDLSFPMKLNFVLTYRCNARCVMCNIWRKKAAGSELTLDEIDAFFSRSNGFSWMDISGGEIFLRDDAVDVFKSALHNCKNLYLIHFATNGLLPAKIISSVEKILLLKPPKLLVTVSLDGHRQLHDKIRGVPGGYDKAIKTFEELRKFNGSSFKVFLGMTLIEDNYREIENSFAAFRKDIAGLGYDDLHINIVQESGHYYDNIGFAAPDPDLLYGIIRSIRDRRRRVTFSAVEYLERRYLSLAETFLKTKRCPQECQSLSSSCFMDPEGYVYPCNTYNKVIGNIRDFDYDLKKLLASDHALKFRREIKEGLCPQCWTPCEAYQTIIANFLGLRKGKR